MMLYMDNMDCNVCTYGQQINCHITFSNIYQDTEGRLE